MMAIHYLTEADKWKSLWSCLAGQESFTSNPASDDEHEHKSQRQKNINSTTALIDSAVTNADGPDFFSSSMDSDPPISELEVEIFSHPNSDDEGDTEGYCTDDDENDTTLVATTGCDIEVGPDLEHITREEQVSSAPASPPPARPSESRFPEIRVDSPGEERLERFLALEAEASTILNTFQSNPTVDTCVTTENADFDVDTLESSEKSVVIDSPFFDAPFPTLAELEAFESAVLSKPALGHNPHVDKYVTMGAFILLIRAQINIDNYKDFVCSAFLISWFQLEESFALPDRLEESHSSDEMIQIHIRMWTLVNNMHWRSFLDVAQLDSAACLFRDYAPQLLRPRINPPKAF